MSCSTSTIVIPRRASSTMRSSISRVSVGLSPGRGLVEEQQLRLGGDGPGDLEPLQRAVRHVARVGADIGAASDEVHQLRGLPAQPPVGRGEAGPARHRGEKARIELEMRAEHHVLDGRESRRQLQVLEGSRDTAARERFRRSPGDLLPLDRDRAGRRPSRPR